MLHQPIEVCFSPALYHLYHKPESVVVIADILRATTAICTAFKNGADKIIPVSTLNEAREYKQKGYLVAAERDGIKCDFADFGNSPFNFTSEKVKNMTIVYSTTNGTQAIHQAKGTYAILIGSFLNISAITQAIHEINRPVVIFCAGWKDKFNLEDTLFAGAIANKLIENYNYITVCDSTNAAIDLWKIAQSNVLQYLEKAAHRHRLKKNNLDDVLEYCFTMDVTNVVPVFQDNFLYAKIYCENINNFSTQ